MRNNVFQLNSELENVPHLVSTCTHCALIDFSLIYSMKDSGWGVCIVKTDGFKMDSSWKWIMQPDESDISLAEPELYFYIWYKTNLS